MDDGGPNIESILLTERSKIIQSLKKKAEKGDAEANFELAKRYRDGDGVFKNDNTAFKHFKRSAELGHVKGQVETGYAYEHRIGIKRSYVKAASWYRVAARLGNNPDAQFYLGVIHFRGMGGVEHDFSLAQKLFNQAAKQGHAGAQFFLGAMHEDGWGVPKDRVKAYVYYSRAMQQPELSRAVDVKFDPEKMRGKLEKKMTRAELQEARRLAKAK
ncbi:MAG: sel1 repeat family protein [Rhodospirillales bacterium]|nr:sel1 repeat family protein [Rhodospirillales bacterium]